MSLLFIGPTVALMLAYRWPGGALPLPQDPGASLTTDPGGEPPPHTQGGGGGAGGDSVSPPPDAAATFPPSEPPEPEPGKPCPPAIV